MTNPNTPPRTMPHMWSFAQQREAQIAALQAENKALREWSQAAYIRLDALMTIGVSMTPDAVTAQLLQDAPPSVVPGPPLAELAADMWVSERELIEYAVESVGAPEGETK